jgi:lysine 2,3-aminomutase
MTSRTLRSAADLVSAGLSDEARARDLAPVMSRYPVAIPHALASLINPSDPADPIARQYMPHAAELEQSPSEADDPIGDVRHAPVEGIVHRYADRALLKVVHICPVYCRFCFRREMVGPGKEPNLSPEALDAALAYVAGTPHLREIILTGGDPLILAPHRIADLTARLSAIPHVKRIRWHTRVPVVEPGWITRDLVTALQPGRAQVILAIHANHPREFSAEAEAAIARLSAANIRLLSQSVLLRGVNDSVDTLQKLMAAFDRNGISPYYIHHADLAPGTGHFRTTIARGRALMDELGHHRKAAAMPTYVLDLPGGWSKVDLMSDAALCNTERQWRLRDDTGQWHDYREDEALFR